ncbi:MAG: phosphate ABC transporter substrate-binding protein PstS [Thermodesulfobacteriota bacterium]
MKTILQVAVVAIWACMLSPGRVEAADRINGAGASFPFPVYSAWAYDYNKATGVQVNYQSIGSGGGIRQITERTVHFGASDAPLQPEQIAKGKLLQFPAVIGGVVIVVNIAGLKSGALRLDADTVAKIFLGEIKYWDDGKIKSQNPTLKLSHDQITVVHRSDGSGTTAVFTEYLNGVSPEWKAKVGAGTAVKWPVGIGAKGNEGVANYVQRTANSAGYVEFAYAEQNKLTYTLLKNAAGTFVGPSFDTFEDAAATGTFDPKNHFYLWLLNAPGKNAWPIAGATFILLAREKTDANRKVVAFYDWAFRNGDRKAKELVYVPLPTSLKDRIRAYWKASGIQ